MAGLGRLEVRHNLSGETGIIILVVVKTSALLAEVDRVVYTAPHFEDTYLLTDIAPVFYLVRFYRSADGINLGEQILSLAADGSSGAVYPMEDIFYTVNGGQPGDPADGDTGLRDPRLLNARYYVEERGTGTLVPETEYVDRSDAGGGFDFTNGKQFFDAGIYVVHVMVRTDVVGDTDGGTTAAGGMVIPFTADADLNPATMLNNTLVAAGGGVIRVLTIPLLVTVPDGDLTLVNHSSSLRYFQLQLNPGNTVDVLGLPRNALYLRKGDSVKISFRAGVCYCVSEAPVGMRQVGKREAGDTVPVNALAADGGTYPQADYPGFVKEFLDILPAGQVVSYTTWNISQNLPYVASSTTTFESKLVYPNKGLFARDDIAGTFRMPDMRKMFIRGYQAGDAERVTDKPGGYQIDQFKRHEHNVNTSGASNTDPGRSFKRTGTTGDGFFNGQLPNKMVQPTGGNENRGENLGLIFSVNI